MKLKVAVIGEGASGIMAAISLGDIGQTEVQVFERESDIS